MAWTLYVTYGDGELSGGVGNRMSVTRIAQELGKYAIAQATCGGSQNFLGARWVAPVVDRAPERVRPRVALRLLSLSPHYFYASDLTAEAERNRLSRQALAEQLVGPWLDPADRVIDYGCGPGYLAATVASKVAHVDAVDISAGVLACARALNGQPNISYLTPAQLRRGPDLADLAYSVAVVQHLRTDVLAGALALLAARIRPGGRLLLHFAVPGPAGWRTEADWGADRSLAAQAKLRYGLHCFGRSPAELAALVEHAGFTGVEVRELTGALDVPGDDDVSSQHLLLATRR
jgi:SAM-dependent methyltransferase